MRSCFCKLMKYNDDKCGGKSGKKLLKSLKEGREGADLENMKNINFELEKLAHKLFWEAFYFFFY